MGPVGEAGVQGSRGITVSALFIIWCWDILFVWGVGMKSRATEYEMYFFSL